MSLDRRDFLKLCSAAGIGVVAASSLNGDASAETSFNYDGALWLNLHLGGGWDVTSICDPKGYLNSPTDSDRMNNYAASAIRQAGNIKYAPMDLVDNNDPAGTQALFDGFFTRFSSELTVINGIDNSTNSHDAGTRVTWSGMLTEGGPTFSALIAAAYLPTSPLGFITNGGYEVTAGVAAAARTGNIDALRRIAYPNRIFANDVESPDFHTEETVQRIQAVRKARYEARMANQKLPRLRDAMSRIYTSRLGQNELKALTEYLPDDIENGLRGQGQLAIAAYKAGLCCSANLSTGGFDTHGNNDQGQIGALSNVLDGVMFIMDYAEQMGVRDNVVLTIGSDFGRTPGYNDGNGKDHWAITSMMVMGSIKGNQIPGNKVVGETTYDHNPVEQNGVRITPAHVQSALRKLAGIDTNEVVQLFPLGNAEEIDIFG
jgi:uncharacterized protein (DUF1501 family)